MRVCFHPDYACPLPEGHPFPISKFPLLHQTLLDEGLIAPGDVHQPEPVDWEDLALVHSAEYLGYLQALDYPATMERRLGMPFSEPLLRRYRLAAQGTIEVGRFALQDGLAGNLAGGTHHAFAERGEGFCLLNDVAVAIRVLQREGRIRRALVVDLDVHQGNGTAAIFRDDPEVFTFSVHGAKNFPARKEQSDLDVGLPDQTGDADYLTALGEHLPRAVEAAQPDIVFYVAGVDVLAGDRFGRLALTREGLAARERAVLEGCRRAALPLAIVLGGGYASHPSVTADLHAVAHREAARVGSTRPEA